MYDRISIDSRICHGQACVRRTRIPVYQIVRMLANGDTIEELLGEYPSRGRTLKRASIGHNLHGSIPFEFIELRNGA